MTIYPPKTPHKSSSLVDQCFPRERPQEKTLTLTPMFHPQNPGNDPIGRMRRKFFASSTDSQCCTTHRKHTFAGVNVTAIRPVQAWGPSSLSVFLVPRTGLFSRSGSNNRVCKFVKKNMYEYHSGRVLAICTNHISTQLRGWDNSCWRWGFLIYRPPVYPFYGDSLKSPTGLCPPRHPISYAPKRQISCAKLVPSFSFEVYRFPSRVLFRKHDLARAWRRQGPGGNQNTSVPWIAISFDPRPRDRPSAPHLHPPNLVG